MKRKIFETLKSIEKKCVLCLMVMGFTAMNTGFTEQDEEIPAEPVEQVVEVEETSATEPTAIAVGENGRLTVDADDELTRAFADVVERSLGQDLTQADAPFDNINTIEDLPELEEPEPANVIETSEGYLDYSHAMDMEATAYLPTDGDGACITAMGIPATYGIVAVDPDPRHYPAWLQGLHPRLRRGFGGGHRRRDLRLSNRPLHGRLLSGNGLRQAQRYRFRIKINDIHEKNSLRKFLQGVFVCKRRHLKRFLFLLISSPISIFPRMSG